MSHTITETSPRYFLEHAILEALYTKVSFRITGEGKLSGKTMPVYKRDYEYSSLHFGTLVDVVNWSEKYTPEKIKQAAGGKISYLKELQVTEEEVQVEGMKYGWIDVNDALEVLAQNGDVKEGNVTINVFSDNMKREIYLTGKGAISYRSGYYLQEAEKELSTFRGYQIQKRDLWLKKYWLLVELSKYIVGGIVGALIALGAAQIRKPQTSQQEKSTPPKSGMVSTYTKKDIF